MNKAEQFSKNFSKNIKKEDAIRLYREFKEKFKNKKDKYKNNPFFGKYIKQCELMYEVIVSWYKREYQAPWQMIGAVTAALLYVLNPVDFVPDFIPVIGLIDDAFIIALCFKLVNNELINYCDQKGLNKEEYGL